MRTLTIFLISLFSLPLALNAQSVDEMLQKVSAAIEAGQNGQAVSYFRQTIPLNIDRTEMYYWTNVDKNSEISSKLATELALAYKKKRNYDKAYLFYKELLQKDPNNVDCLETCAEMQVCRGQEKDALRMYEKILQLDADNLAANIFLGNYYYLMAEQEKKKLETDTKNFLLPLKCSMPAIGMDYRSCLLPGMRKRVTLYRKLFYVFHRQKLKRHWIRY